MPVCSDHNTGKILLTRGIRTYKDKQYPVQINWNFGVHCDLHWKRTPSNVAVRGASFLFHVVWAYLTSKKHLEKPLVARLLHAVNSVGQEDSLPQSVTICWERENWKRLCPLGSLLKRSTWHGGTIYSVADGEVYMLLPGQKKYLISQRDAVTCVSD